MTDSLLSWPWANKKSRKKTTKRVTSVVEALPLVKTIQAGQEFLQVGETLRHVREGTQNLKDAIPKACQLLDGVNQFVPSMQVMGKSFCDSITTFQYFNAIATTAGIGANAVLTYQGIQALEHIAAKLEDISTSLAAQTALTAQKEFPGYVYKMIRQRLGETADDQHCDHCFFLYHPDNDWYPEFYHLLENEPLGSRFGGYTNQIDTVFAFMVAERQRRLESEQKAERKGRSTRPIKLHLLIPAYQPILVAEPVQVPNNIGDFVMEGRINSDKKLVWLNLPEEQRRYVLDIGLWAPPNQGWWDWAMLRLGLVQPQPMTRRVLGGQLTLGESLDITDSDKGENNGETTVVGAEVFDDKKRRRHATPLHGHGRNRRERGMKA